MNITPWPTRTALGLGVTKPESPQTSNDERAVLQISPQRRVIFQGAIPAADGNAILRDPRGAILRPVLGLTDLQKHRKPISFSNSILPMHCNPQSTPMHP